MDFETLFMGVAIALLFNVFICFVWWVGRGLLRKFRDRHVSGPIDISDPREMVIVEGGIIAIGFRQPNGDILYRVADEVDFPEGFKPGDRLRYFDQKNGEVWSLPTRIDA